MNISGYVDVESFSRAMAAVPKSIRKELRIDMKRAADVWVKNAKDLAPVDSNHLRSRIRSRQASWDSMTYEIVSDAIKRVSSAGPYPSFQEFGTKHNKSHPYIRPALKLSKPEMKKIIENSIFIGIQNGSRRRNLSLPSRQATLN